MSRSFVFGSGNPEIIVRGKAPRYEVVGDGRSESVEVRILPDGRVSILFADGRQISGRARRRGGEEVEISTARGRRCLAVNDPLRARLSSVAEHAGGGGPETEEVRALMPGRVVGVSVAPGDSVESGGLLLVLEAMKMQNELRATHAGVVLQCAVAAGQTVDAGALLLTIQPAR